MVGEPELLKDIMIRDFDHFCDRSFVTFNEPIMDDMLLGLKGAVWKRVRSVMTPVFSSGKVKHTLSLANVCAANLIKFFEKKLYSGHCVFEMKEVYGMFTMDTIASIAFGVSSDSLNNTQDEFSAAAARFFAPVPGWRRPFVWLQQCFPRLSKRCGFTIRTPIHFFSKVVSDTIEYRLKHNLRRSDFLQLLLDASLQEQVKDNSRLTVNTCRDSDDVEDNMNCDKDKNTKTAEHQPVLTKEIITAQCVLFYMAGYDTTATTLSFVSYCLALHPAIQQNLMEEIERVLAEHNNLVTYEVIQELTYLDMVFAETLRLFPPAPHVDRHCNKDYTLAGTGITVEAGTKITIPIYSIHRDPQHYEDPEIFNPDRFSSDNRSRRSQTIYMPFGAGPRNCIGKRFALMEAKIALVHLLQEFAFLPCKKTQVPIVLDKKSGLLKAESGVWLRLAKRVAS